MSLSCKPLDPALSGVVEIAFEPFDLRDGFKREDVGAAAVRKEVVVRDDDRIASRKYAYPFLLVVAPESECGAVSSQVRFGVAKLRRVATAEDFFPDGLVQYKEAPVLVGVRKLRGLPERNRAAVRRSS